MTTFQFMKYAKPLASIYFIGLSLVNVIGSLVSQKLGWSEPLLLLICALPVLLRKRNSYLAFGVIAAVLSLWLFLAVSSDYIHYKQGQHYTDSLSFFGVGYALSVCSLFFSSVYIISGLQHKKREALA